MGGVAVDKSRHSCICSSNPAATGSFGNEVFSVSVVCFQLQINFLIFRPTLTSLSFDSFAISGTVSLTKAKATSMSLFG